MKEVIIAGEKYLDFTKIPEVRDMPNLLEVQRDSYNWFLREGMRDLISTVSPIEDMAGQATVELLDYRLGDPTNHEDVCRERDLTYQAPLRMLCRLVIKDQETGGILEAKEQEVYLGEFPIMTDTATFIVNGAERVLVSQLIRSPGIYLKEEMDASGGTICSARLIPNSGWWIQIEYDAKDILWIRVDKARKLPFTTFLRALGFEFQMEGEIKTMRYEGGDFVVENPVAEDVMGYYTRETLEGTRRDTGEIVKIAKAGERLDAERAKLVEKCRLGRIKLFERIEPIEIRKSIENTLAKDDDVKTQEDALIKVYERLKQEPYPGRDYAEEFLFNRLFKRKFYDFSKVGRYKMNVKLHVDVPVERPTLMREDFVKILEYVLKLKAKKDGFEPDDIDHLSHRRVRGIGELIQNQMRLGFARMERLAKEKMASQDVQTLTPQDVINYRPVQSALNEFFGSNQLSQFMDQTNPLSELTHKRRVSALGPQGLTRERAGFEVRDVHHSHYGRICPIESPEGPNIGLISSLACYARLGEYGFIQTPYRHIKSQLAFKVIKKFEADGKSYKVGDIVDEATFEKHYAKGVDAFFEHEVTEEVAWREAFEEEDTREHFVSKDQVTYDNLLGKTVSRTLIDPDSGVTILQKGELLNGEDVLRLKKLDLDKIGDIRVVEPVRIVQANVRTENNRFTETRISLRENHEPVDLHPETVRLQYMDVSAKQIISVTTALIPFLEHDDANRALMGSNMQRQAVPLIKTESPVVGTGMERKIAADSGCVVVAKHPGVVEFVNSERVIVKRHEGGEKDEYKLVKWRKSNQGTTINQTPCVNEGDEIVPGTVLADGPSTQNGALALGKNVIAAFVPWYGYNFEDAIIISERLMKNYTYCSFHIEKSECEARDTKLGPEEITKDIPTVAEEVLKNLDEEGIVRIGVHVKAEDILVGKVIPRGESELSSEEKIIRAIFGDKAKDVRNTSLKVKPGMEGKVIDVKVYSRENGDDLKPGVNKLVRVFIAQKKNIQVGDKMAGRHGNKGILSNIVPLEDMPFLEDGSPVDIILNPLGVPSRMNVGQILETQLGYIVHKLGFKAITPVFNGATVEEMQDLAARAGVPSSGKVKLYDGKTGEGFDGEVLVGQMYMMKLNHLVEDKMHARSTGSYALVTQQPLGGKAQFGGQRLGEMEVWALEAYGAANLLQELLTIKSDDVAGRVKTYEAIVKGKNIQSPGMPESFNVLVKELQALGMKITLYNRFGQEARIVEDRDSNVGAIARKVGLKGYF